MSCDELGWDSKKATISFYDGSSSSVFSACGLPFYGVFFSFRLAFCVGLSVV